MSPRPTRRSRRGDIEQKRRKKTRRKKTSLELKGMLPPAFPSTLVREYGGKGQLPRTCVSSATEYSIQNLEEKKPRPLVKASTGTCKLDKHRGITKKFFPFQNSRKWRSSKTKYLQLLSSKFL